MSTQPTVLITDYEFSSLDIEREIFGNAGIELIADQLASPQAIIEKATAVDADALLVQYAHIPAAVFETLPNLTAVSIYGIGVDNIDVETATEQGIPVLHVPDYCIDEVAEHTIALLLSVWRKTAYFDSRVKTGEWDWEQGWPVTRLAGSTIGIYGFGKIGRRLAQKYSGFDVELIATDPFVDSDVMAKHNVTQVSFDELLRLSDAISIHAPLTERTEAAFDAEAFDRMAEDAVLVNTARGSIVVEDALVSALRDESIRGAGIDVFSTEPPEDSPLFECQNAVLTPHMAWYSQESITDLRTRVAEDLVAVLQGDVPDNPVNPEVLR